MPLANKPRRGKYCSITAPTSIQPGRIRQPCTRSVAMHPLRRDAPDQKGCNAYGSGAPPHRQQARPRAIPPDRPQPSASDTATRPRHAHPGSEREALHHLASITPPPSWCNTPLSGVTPLSNKPTRGEARPLALPTSHRPNQTGQPCTRYVAVHPIRRGAMPTDRVHHLPKQVSVWRYTSPLQLKYEATQFSGDQKDDSQLKSKPQQQHR